MSLILVDVLFGLAMAGMGAAAGWWLCARSPGPDGGPDESEDVRRAHEVLGCLQKLASSVATELGEHHSRVEEINEELMTGSGKDPAKIINVVAKLVDTNRSMQSRLDKAEDRLREQAQLVESHAAEARTDALTLVGNRRAFDAEMAERLAEFRRSGQGFVLAMLDLDKFKRFNDTYGHLAGDEVLRGVGRVLRRAVREHDVVARYGGEEFALVLSQAPADECRQALLRLGEAIEKAAFAFQDKVLRITASIGATQTLANTEIADVIRQADEALYASKEAGRNCVHWHDGQRVFPVLAPPPPVPERPVPPAEVGPLGEDAGPDAPNDDLLNRTAFFQQVRSRVAEWKRGGPALSLVLVKIDRYEHFSRQYDQKVREEAMRSLTKVVRNTVREMDPVARYSASCLAFLLPGARLPDAVRVAERIRQTVLQLAAAPGSTALKFSVSGGMIEVLPGDDLLTLFRRAEMALEAGQHCGGNCTYQHDGAHCVPAAVLVENA